MDGNTGCGNVGGVEGSGVASGVDFPAVSSASGQHRRSRSASERKLEFTRDQIPKCSRKNPSGLLGTVQDKRANVQEQDYQDSQDNPACATPSHRVSLENDIEQLQMRLHQEKSARIMLERALGRASSTLSPRHKHFNSQTRELISEIQLLEDEVAIREQHVLSLYRSIFDQSVSGPPSSQCSGTPSPSHTKPGAKKHPLVISSAFCSSRKFSLQSFHVLSSIKDSGKKDATLQSKTAHQLNGHTNYRSRRNMPMKVNTTISMAGKTYLSYAPKHNSMYHCPSKLSEELVRWMASIYRRACEEEIEDRGKAQTPILSRSSTSTVLPRYGVGDDRDPSTRTVVEVSSISTNKNPFSTTSVAISNYRALVEQLVRVDISKLESKAKLAFWVNVHNSLVMHAYLTYGIPYSSLGTMSLFRKAAYNIGGQAISASTIEHFILCCHTPRINRLVPVLGNSVVNSTGGVLPIPLCRASPGRYTQWLETILWTTIRKKSGEEKQILSSGFSLLVTQPLVRFGLCTGASSDPLLRVYTAKHVEEELEMAKKDFLQANVAVKKSRKVFLPKLLDKYAKETSINADDLLTWVSNNVDSKLQESIQKCINSNSKKKASQIIEWLPYNTRFRYMFDKSLTETPLHYIS